ncbi:MAG TPA: NPCBM/NEW2 domain-containing protein, partial [Tepidisphaeraceae bacterium]|nr:NPCBM/NEW2 domain-containing protein [Tepidisphaeraceae bacterium]
LSSIPWTSATAGWGTVQLNQSIAGNPLTLHGVVYPSGIGTHASSTITYSLDGKYNTFVSDVGLDAEEIGVGSGAVDFQVIGDGKVLFDSGVLTPSSPTVHIAVSVAGVQTLTLQVNPQVAGDINYDHSDWAGAELLVDPAIPTAPTAPANLAAIAIGSASINLTWSATSTNQTSFTILRSTDGSNFAPIATGVAANSTTYTDSANLAAGTEYYYEVEAVSSAGASPASNIASATTAALSPIVTPLSSIPWTSATAGWGTVQLNQSIAGNPLTLHGVVYPSGIGTHASSTITYSLAGKYNTFVSDVGLDAEEIGVGSGAVDFQVIGDGKVLFDSGVLTPSSPTVHIAVSVAGVQTLTLQVNPQVAGDIDYDHSDWAGAELLVAAAIPTAPTAPANLAALATGQSSINLTWSATSTNQTSFTILRSTDGSNFAPIATGVAANSTTYTDAANLATGTEYYYEVEAVNSVASSAPSNIASAATAALAPIVTPLSSIPWTSATAGWGTVQLNQSIKDNPLTLHGVVYPSGIGTHASSTITYNLGGQYTTFISDVGLDDEEIGVGSGAVDFQVIGDGKVLFDSGVLTPSSPTVHIAISVAGVQTLTLQVNPQVAGDIDYDHSDWAGAELLSTPAAPIAPANLTATPMGSTSVKLTWTASPGATSYQVDRSTDGVNWTTVATSLSGSLTSWIDTAGIQASTEYYFRVRAVNSIGTSSNSNVANATTSALDTVTYVSSLPWTTATVGWGTIQENASILGNPITIHGVVYASGIGTHAASNISYSLAGQYTSFLADVGLDDEEIGVGSGAVDFQVIGTTNGVQTVLFDSGVLTPNSPTVSINVSVVGVQTLTLVVNPGIVGTIDYDHADWADARLTV